MKRLNVFLFTLAILMSTSVWFSFKFYRHHKYDHFKHSSPDHLDNVMFTRTEMKDVVKDMYTSLTIGPDHRLYAGTLHGRIIRYNILKNGDLQLDQIFEPFGKEERLMIGLEFDPKASANDITVWISYAENSDVVNGPEWDCNLSRLKLSPKSNKVIEHTLVLDNLPRSARDHATNSLTFGPDGALYFNQGSNTSMGKANSDEAWDFREESLLSAAILRLDISKLPEELPLDVKPQGEGGAYNPFTTDAPLTIYATGVRNAYDLVWHSSGELYVPVNGSMGGFDSPTSNPDDKRYVAPNPLVKYDGPTNIPAVTNISEAQDDRLFRVEKGGYYGHPNTARAEYIVGEGAKDMSHKSYEGIEADPNYRGYVYNFGKHASPNGIIEYRSDACGGILKGKLIVVRFNLYFDLMIIEPGNEKNNFQVEKAYDGEPLGIHDLDHPLDLIEDTLTGRIYVAEMRGEHSISMYTPKRISTKDKQTALKAKIKKAELAATSNINASNVTLLDNQELLEEGKAIFLKNCTVCHTSKDGHGQGPNLFDHEWLYGSDIKSVFTMIENGSSKGMLAWKGRLSPEEIQKVASFIILEQEKNNRQALNTQETSPVE